MCKNYPRATSLIVVASCTQVLASEKKVVGRLGRRNACFNLVETVDVCSAGDSQIHMQGSFLCVGVRTRSLEL